MANEWNDEAELGLFKEFLNRSDLSWPEIRQGMIDAGHEDRGPRSYQSKAYRMVEALGEPDDVIEYAIYKFVRDDTKTLSQLCNKFDMPPAKMRTILDGMKGNGYNIIESKGVVAIPVASKPKVEFKDTVIRDEGHKVSVAFYSDPHVGSRYAQPTALKKFCDMAYHEYGVRHFFNPGDTFSGIYGYRGHDYDLMPAGRPLSRNLAHLAVDRVVETAADWIPRYDDAEHYVLGGNHDWWMVAATGKDAVRNLCRARDDMHYCGYDVCSIPLTDNTHLKLWHPGGGGAYAKCLSEDTQILTKRGWVGLDTITMSDEVATKNPQTDMLEYQNPTDLFIERYNGKMYRFSSRTVDHLVTPDHDVWVRKYNQANPLDWQKVEAQGLKDAGRQEWQLTMEAEWEGTEQKWLDIPAEKTNLLQTGLKHVGRLDMDALLEYLGWWISEGSVHTKDKGLTITQAVPKNLPTIRDCHERLGIGYKEYSKSYEGKYKSMKRFVVYSAEFTRWVISQCGQGSYNKRVPRWIMDLSSRQIGIFLDALFAGDGWWEVKHKRWDRYKSMSDGLLDDIQELALKVGHAATIGSNNDLGVLEQATPTINTPPTQIDYNGHIWCVQVPNGLIYARRNGKPVWTGNSYNVQKFISQQALNALNTAIANEENPKVSIIAGGHIHIAVWVPSHPIMGGIVGCFEGQTNYLKKKGLYPDIGGVILDLTFDDAGKVRHSAFHWVPFYEVEDDWKNHWVPEIEELNFGPDQLNTVFEITRD